MERVSLVVQHRDATGSRATRRLRHQGLIPGVMYGHGDDAHSVAVDPHGLRAALSTDAGTHAVLDVTFEGTKKVHKAIVKDLVLDPLKNTVLHLDLQEIRLDETIETTVAVRFEGEAKGVKAGGMLDESTREVTVKGVVTDIPEHLVINISELDYGETVKVADLTAPEGIEILDDPELVLASVLAPRVEAEAEEAAEEAAPSEAEPAIVGKGEKEEEAEG